MTKRKLLTWAISLVLLVPLLLYGARIAGDLTLDGDLVFEGATADAFETTLGPVDPTADRDWILPDADGTVVGLDTVQTFATGTKTVTSKFDFGGGVLEVPNSTTLPGTCTVGEVYMDTDAASGQRIYACESTDSWVLQGGGGSSDLIYSCATSVDVGTPGNTSATAATCVIPADTLAVGDFCRAHSSWTYADDGDATGTWQACMTLNGNTFADNMHSCAAAINSVTAQISDSTFSIDSSTVAEWYGGLTRGTPVANWGGGTVDVIVGSSMDFNFRAVSSGAGDTGDTVTFKFGSVQCWRTTP